MKTLIALLTLAGIGVSLATPAAATDRIDVRQHGQAKRIEIGVRTGALTPHEAARLRAEQARIDRMAAGARRDGYLSPSERARIAAAQDRASRHIYAEKHDGDRRRTLRRHRWW